MREASRRDGEHGGVVASASLSVFGNGVGFWISRDWMLQGLGFEDGGRGGLSRARDPAGHCARFTPPRLIRENRESDEMGGNWREESKKVK